MPPALRRSVSSPSVRVAPYHVSSSSSTHHHSATPSTDSSTASSAAAVAPRPRRGASETSGRRVLADIEWWRVMPGQQSDEYDNEHEDAHDGYPDDENENAAAPDADGTQARPHTPEPISPLYIVSEDVHASPVAQQPSPGSSAPSSSQSTPSRPRAHHSLSYPGLNLSAIRILDLGDATQQ